MFVCCEYCVLSGRGLRDGLITRPEESYRASDMTVHPTAITSHDDHHFHDFNNPRFFTTRTILKH